MRKRILLIVAILVAALALAAAAYVLRLQKKPTPTPRIVPPCTIPPCDPKLDRPCIAPASNAPCPMPL